MTPVVFAWPKRSTIKFADGSRNNCGGSRRQKPVVKDSRVMREPAILLVDDDPLVRRAISRALELAGMQVTLACDGTSALAELKRRPFDLALLEVTLPDIKGTVVCEAASRIRDLGIILITGTGDKDSMVRAPDHGADDYMHKPFGTEELLARIRAVLRRSRRSGEAPSAVLIAGALELNVSDCTASINGKSVRLTRTEHRILMHLAEHAEQVVSRSALLDAVWGSGFQEAYHLLQVTISRLRRKLGTICPTDAIRTYPGTGYMFDSRCGPSAASPSCAASFIA
jgi:two-component system KDP operon response regulator KdpE